MVAIQEQEEFPVRLISKVANSEDILFLVFPKAVVGACSPKLPSDLVKRYVKVVNFLRAAWRIEDLFLIKSLHYEKKKGDLNGVDVVWINDQYRLLFRSSPDEAGIIVNALIFEISKHYE